MPELPEVETIARQLDGVLAGKEISKIEVLRTKSFLGDVKVVVGRKITGVERRAKMMAISFSGTDMLLTVHLKMTGQLIYIENPKNQKFKNSKRIVGGHPTPDWINDLPNKHTRVIIDFSGGEKLFFNDLRVFGWMRLVTKEDWNKIISKLPPDVTSKEFTKEYFEKVIRSSGRSVKLVLLDQAKIGGVGNIYANDALYMAKIDPRRKSKELDQKEIGELYKAVKHVIELGVKYGGASVDKYVDAAGVGGKYQEHFFIYKKDGEKCGRDGTIIKKIKIGGRGTYFCSGCQK